MLSSWQLMSTSALRCIVSKDSMDPSLSYGWAYLLRRLSTKHVYKPVAVTYFCCICICNCLWPSIYVEKHLFVPWHSEHGRLKSVAQSSCHGNWDHQLHTAQYEAANNVAEEKRISHETHIYPASTDSGGNDILAPPLPHLSYISKQQGIDHITVTMCILVIYVSDKGLIREPWQHSQIKTSSTTNWHMDSDRFWSLTLILLSNFPLLTAWINLGTMLLLP